MAGTGDKKNQISLSTVDDFRVPLWPVGRHAEGLEIKTPWGTVRFLDGSPSSRQQEALIAIATVAVATRTDEVGRIHVLFDVPEVQKLMGCDDWNWLKGKLIELISFKVEQKREGEDWGKIRTILAGVGDSDVDAPRKKGQKTAKYKEIIFSEITSELIRNGLLVFMERSVVESVLSLQHPVSRGVARFFISHSTNQTHDIHAVLNAVGCGGGERMFRKYRAQIQDDEEGLAKVGITLMQNKIASQKIKGVWFKKNGTDFG